MPIIYLMDNIPIWAKHLNISLSDLKHWQSQLQIGENLLCWSIENKKIDEDAYLDWAKEHYKLPIAKIHFFEQHPPYSLIEKCKSFCPQNVIPLHEWDGILFLACIEPIENFQAPIPYRWVLASLSGIKKWTQKPGEKKIENLDLAVPDAPDGLKIDLPRTQADSSPLGLVELDPSKNVKPILETANLIAPPPIGDSKTQDNTVIQAPEIPKTNSDDDLDVNFQQTGIFKLNEKQKKDDAKIINSHAEIKTIEDIAFYAFTKLSPQYKQSMVLIYNNSNMIPWRWSETWPTRPKSQTVIGLNTPSIFRIAYTSKNAFHGPIAPNPINNAFFQHWNSGVTPPHITICSLIIGTEVAGLLLATNPMPTAEGFSLKFVSDIANEISELFSKCSYPKKEAA